MSSLPASLSLYRYLQAVLVPFQAPEVETQRVQGPSIMGLAGPCDLTESFIWPLGKKRDPYNSSHSVQYVKCRWESSQT